MTVDEAARDLAARGVPHHLYQIGGPCGNDTIGIDKSNDSWTVFYCERGQKDVLLTTPSEADAVTAFLAEVERAHDFIRRNPPRPGV